MKHSPAFLAIVNDALTRVDEITVEEVRSDQESGADFVRRIELPKSESDENKEDPHSDRHRRYPESDD